MHRLTALQAAAFEEICTDYVSRKSREFARERAKVLAQAMPPQGLRRFIYRRRSRAQVLQKLDLVSTQLEAHERKVTRWYSKVCEILDLAKRRQPGVPSRVNLDELLTEELCPELRSFARAVLQSA